MRKHRGLWRGKTTPKSGGKAFDNVWVKGNLIQAGDTYYIHPIANTVNVQNELGKLIIMHEVDPETLGEYTGLKDRNGVKIFEGDICRLTHDWHDGTFGEWCAVVEFGNPNGTYNWGWQLRRISGEDCYNPDILLWVDMEDTGATCEVVGNAHDNPELLEAKS